MDKISVVMATYNGERHIIKQLESLRDQTRKPDEVLIFDDQSKDRTVDIVQCFIAQNRLNTWHLKINELRLGWKKNFIEGIKQTTGSLIFLCDQDDVWYKEKIQKMAEGIIDNEHILLLACDYNVVYEPGAIKAKVYKKNQREAAGLVAKYEFKKNFFMNPNPGCSYVLRRSFVDSVIGRWFPLAPHDEFFWLMATIQDGAFFYNNVLMDYIRYAGNNSEIRYKDIKMQQQNLEYISLMLQKMVTVINESSERSIENYNIKKERLQYAMIWCKKRKQLMRTRNPMRWFLMIPLWGYYNSMKNCLSDLWLILFGKFNR